MESDLIILFVFMGYLTNVAFAITEFTIAVLFGILLLIEEGPSIANSHEFQKELQEMKDTSDRVKSLQIELSTPWKTRFLSFFFPFLAAFYIMKRQLITIEIAFRDEDKPLPGRRFFNASRKELLLQESTLLEKV